MKKQRNKFISIYTKFEINYRLDKMLFNLNIEEGDNDKDDNFINYSLVTEYLLIKFTYPTILDEIYFIKIIFLV